MANDWCRGVASSFLFHYGLFWVPGLSSIARRARGACGARWQEEGAQVTRSNWDGINLKDHRQPKTDCDLEGTGVQRFLMCTSLHGDIQYLCCRKMSQECDCRKRRKEREGSYVLIKMKSWGEKEAKKKKKPGKCHTIETPAHNETV